MVDTQELEQRGEEFLKCTKPRHLYYSRRSLDTTPLGHNMQVSDPDTLSMTWLFSETVESQVVVNFERTLLNMPDWTPSSNPPLYTNELSEFEDDLEVVAGDRKWEQKIREEHCEEIFRALLYRGRGESQPTGDDLLLLLERVSGYVLRGRRWVCLSLGTDHGGNEYLKEVSQRSDAWNDLEILDRNKTIIQSLVMFHFSEDRQG